MTPLESPKMPEAIECDFCELPTDTPVTDREDYLNVFCSMECADKHAANVNERAYEHAYTPHY